MKTLLFCTSYSENQNVWDKRIKRWKNWIDSTDLKYDNMLVVDDASPCLPNDIEIVENVELPSKTVLYHFQDHLGKVDDLNYPGWYRSFVMPVKYIEKFDFEKIIHIESDAFLLSDRMIKWVNDLHEGWSGAWCHTYHFPETSIQIICKSSFPDYFKMSLLSFDEVRQTEKRRHSVRFDPRLNRRQVIDNRRRITPRKNPAGIAELWTPFTNVRKDFIGDRWGEKGGVVPRNADYACQMSHDLNEEMFWWLK